MAKIPLSIDTKTSRSIFSRKQGFIAKVRLEDIKPQAAQLSLFLDSLLNASPGVVPPVVYPPKRLVRNIRGRPPETFRQFPLPADAPRIAAEELLRVTGRICQKPQVTAAGTPFSVTVKTNFHSFPNSREILHELRTEASPTLQGLITYENLALLSRIFPIQLDAIELGLEFYRYRVFGSMIGATQSIEARAYLVLTPLSLELFLQDEDVKHSLPLAETGTLSAIDSALRNAGLVEDFTEQLRASMQ